MSDLWRLAARRTAEFDAAAIDYHRYRPRYPGEMFDDIVGLGELPPGAVVVEVGAGTGIATEQLVARDLEVIAIEPSPGMAAIGREATGDRASWFVGRFEEWSPDRPIDLVISCNAWHWVEPGRGVEQAASALRPGGAVAVVWTDVVSWGEHPFEQRLEETFGAPWPKGLDRVQRSLAPLEQDERFSAFQTRRHRFERTLDAATFVAVTRTYGGTHTEEKDRLLSGLIEELGGSVTKVEEAVVHLARRLG